MKSSPSSNMPDEIIFTLQNGSKYLDKYFAEVDIVYNRGRLEITDTTDLVDFIYSVPSLIGVNESDRPAILDDYEKKKNSDGAIVIELEYGMFVAMK